MASSFINRFPLSDTVIGGRVAPLHVNDNNFVGHKRLLPPLRSVTPITTNKNGDVEEETKDGRKMKVSASRRERCRINQARYRKRQRQHADNINEGIQQLQQEIEELENKRQRIVRCSPTDQNVWVVAAEYFQHFRHGYMAPLFETDSLSKKMREHVQLDFLKSSMTADVTDGAICGAEAILDNWRLFSMYHGNIKVQLKRLEQVTSDSLLATTSISLTITENTLRYLYPHLVNGNQASPLTSRLVNQRLVLCGSVRFDWDEVSRRVIRLESKVDLLTPMLKLIGSLENVASVFSQALISPEGSFKE